MRNNFDIEYIERSMGNETIRAYLPIERAEKLEEGEIGDTYVFTMSTEIVDRHGTIIKLDGLDIESYNKNPVVLWMHQSSKGLFEGTYNPDNVIGKGYAYFEDGKLKNRVTFEPESLNKLAQIIKGKIDFGSLRGNSIGFLPYSGSMGDEEKGERSDTYYIRTGDLLEDSIVVIPSNSQALHEKKELKINDDETWDLIPEEKKSDTWKVTSIELVDVPEGKGLLANEAQNKKTIISKMPRKERARKLLKLRKWQLRF